MKFFIDTADINQIKDIHELGLLDGVTTNPTLISQTGKDFETVLSEICEIVDGPVSAEVVSTQKDGILKEGRYLAKLHSNIVIKVPLIAEGIKAVKILSSEGIKTNVTLCFSALQALVAARVGATYISPFIGRLDDIHHEGMQLIRDIRDIYDNYGFETEILTASIRSPMHVLEAALVGSDVSTIPYKVFNQLLQHPLTDRGLEQFLADWKKVPQPGFEKQVVV